MEHFKIYIVILNYKRWQDVIECLDSVFKLNNQNFSVIVIDNNSGNNSLEYLVEWIENKNKYLTDQQTGVVNYALFSDLQFNQEISISSLPKLTFVQNSRNLGFAAGNNVVLKNLIKEDAFVWLLNPDMVVEETALTELISCAMKEDDKSIIGTVIKSFEKPDKVLFYGGAKVDFNTATIKPAISVADINNIDYISGGSMFIQTRHLRDVGLLPEEYFLFWEETHWCYEAKLKGYKMVVCLNAICYDKISTTIGKGFLADYYYTFNGLKFIKKFKTRNIQKVLFFTFIRIIKRVMTGKFERARGMYKGLFAFLKSDNEN